MLLNFIFKLFKCYKLLTTTKFASTSCNETRVLIIFIPRASTAHFKWRSSVAVSAGRLRAWHRREPGTCPESQTRNIPYQPPAPCDCAECGTSRPYTVRRTPYTVHHPSCRVYPEGKDTRLPVLANYWRIRTLLYLLTASAR